MKEFGSSGSASPSTSLIKPALISRLLGAAEHEPAKAAEIKRVSSFAAWGAVIAGAVPATSAFVAVMLAFVPVLAVAFCLEQLVRAEGAARQVMVGLIASTIGNIVFDVLFILVLHWGVAGAALSMGLSNLGIVTYFVIWLARHSEHMSLAPRWFTLSPAMLKQVFGVGVGELLQSGFLIEFQATGRALPATVMSVTQGVLFIPIVILGNLWFGLAGLIWALMVTEVTVFGVGVVIWLASRRAIDRGLAQGSAERADEVLEQAEV